MEPLHLIVGLGNPGAEYAQTRHNVGFLLVEKLAADWKVDWALERKFDARIARAERSGKRVLLCEPQTFMNLSGEAVGALVNFYQLPLKQILVVVDDADLPAGRNPVAGGRQQWRASWTGIHRAAPGVARVCAVADRDWPEGRRRGKSRITCSENLIRPGMICWKKFCIGRPTRPECWLDDGIEKAMNQFNGVVDSANEKEKP